MVLVVGRLIRNYISFRGGEDSVVILTFPIIVITLVSHCMLSVSCKKSARAQT